MNHVLQLIAEGRLCALTLETLQDEILGLHEDILNFEQGHVCESTMATSEITPSADMAMLEANVLISRRLRETSRVLVSRRLRS